MTEVTPPRELANGAAWPVENSDASDNSAELVGTEEEPRLLCDDIED
jgi:hypothetical protein